MSMSCPMRLHHMMPLIILSAILSVNSSTIPHRLYPLESPLARATLSARAELTTLQEATVPPYILSLNEGNSIEVGFHESSNITLNLNRFVDQDVSVLVSIYSGPGLIYFDGATNVNQSQSLPDPPTSIIVSYKAGEFGDKIIKFHTREEPGHAEIVCKVQNNRLKNNSTIDDTEAYISVNIHRKSYLTYVILIVGWIYFFAWSASFYFQIILNYRRKSVVGLNFDFIALNLLGFTCYTIYNATLLFSHEVQSIYYQRHAYTRIPVEYNDLFFSLHAFLVTTITLIQCSIYERGDQRVSMPAGIFVALACILGAGLYIGSLFGSVTILDVVLYLSYVKLMITTIKYTPQAYMNYKRKATTGWSIHNILLDFTGGTFSLAQMFYIAYNYNDWISIFGNFTKFGLAVLSMSFDILFMIQHYHLYKESEGQLEDSTDQLNPVISESIRSATSMPQQQQPPTPGPRNVARFRPYSETERSREEDSSSGEGPVNS